MLTSVLGKTKNEYGIQCWKEAGLLKPTNAKVYRLFTISQVMAIKRLGKLNKREFNEILKSAIALLGKSISLNKLKFSKFSVPGTLNFNLFETRPPFFRRRPCWGVWCI